MYRRVLTALAALTVSMGAVSLAPTQVLAYPPCSSGSSASTSSTTVGSGGTVTLTVTFKDCNGGAVAGSTVTFGSTGPGSCRPTFSPPTAVSDANGQASTTVTFPTDCPGQYTLTGSTQGVTVSAAVNETGGLPLTTGNASDLEHGLPVVPAAVVLLGLLLAVAGSAALLSRRR
jgi:hypothetical protein